MSEEKIHQLQVKQLQEELEYYFLAYQKLQRESQNGAICASFIENVKRRFPNLVLSESITLTGGVDQKSLQRITARFSQVEHYEQKWKAFTVIVNDRKGLLDIEFHAPSQNREYPLSKFIKTGSNRVCDFSLLSPFTDSGKKSLAALTIADQQLLIGIIEELYSRMLQSDVKYTSSTQHLDTSVWPEKLKKLLHEIRELLPQDQESSLKFKKISLKQNMVGASNEHLLISFEELKAYGVFYPNFDLKIGAKQIKDKGFTEYGSLEFRELAENQAPLRTWPPKMKDKWGFKLVIDLPESLNEEHLAVLNNLEGQDQKFIKELLSALVNKIHTMDFKNLKLNQPLENWQKLISTMLEKL